MQLLTELGWLTVEQGVYSRVQSFPTRPLSVEAVEPLELFELGFLNPHLEAIAESLAHPIADVQRFFLEVDYILSPQQRLEPRLEQLKAI